MFRNSEPLSESMAMRRNGRVLRMSARASLTHRWAKLGRADGSKLCAHSIRNSVLLMECKERNIFTDKDQKAIVARKSKVAHIDFSDS